MEQENITHKVIGCAYEVYNTLGFGFLESIYHKAMLIELDKSGFTVESEKPLKVLYGDKIIGEFSVDIYVENEIIVAPCGRIDVASIENSKPGH